MFTKDANKRMFYVRDGSFTMHSMNAEHSRRIMPATREALEEYKKSIYDKLGLPYPFER